MVGEDGTAPPVPPDHVNVKPLPVVVNCVEFPRYDSEPAAIPPATCSAPVDVLVDAVVLENALTPEILIVPETSRA